MSNSNVTYLATSTSARQDVAAAVRAHMAVRDIKDTELARKVGWSQSYVSRRTNAGTAFTVDDLGVIATEFRLSIAELVQMPIERPDDGGPVNGKATDYGWADSPVIDIADRIRAARPTDDGALATVTNMWA